VVERDGRVDPNDQNWRLLVLRAKTMLEFKASAVRCHSRCAVTRDRKPVSPRVAAGPRLALHGDRSRAQLLVTFFAPALYSDPCLTNGPSRSDLDATLVGSNWVRFAENGVFVPLMSYPYSFIERSGAGKAVTIC
jgi:hypothetical protein